MWLWEKASGHPTKPQWIRRLDGFNESPYQLFKSELRTLREEVVELRRIVRGLEMKNADQDEF